MTGGVVVLVEIVRTVRCESVLKSGRAPEVRNGVQIGAGEVAGAGASAVAPLVRKTASGVLHMEVVHVVRRMGVLMSGHESEARAGARNGVGDDGGGRDDGDGKEIGARNAFEGMRTVEQ